MSRRRSWRVILDLVFFILPTTAALAGDWPQWGGEVIADGKVFIGTNDANLNDPRYHPTGGGLLLCLDEATGKRLWQLVVPKLLEGKRSKDFDDMNLGICSTPAVADGVLYVASQRYLWAVQLTRPHGLASNAAPHKGG